MKTILIRVRVPDDMNLPLSLIVFQDANIFFRAEKYIEIIQRPTDERGVAGCTYGDTDYDSKSVAYGYNLALNQIFGFGEDGE